MHRGKSISFINEGSIYHLSLVTDHFLLPNSYFQIPIFEIFQNRANFFMDDTPSLTKVDIQV